MLSILCDLTGFAAFAVAAFLIAGVAAVLIVVGAECLLIGAAFDGALVEKTRKRRKGK